jgi:hypothetical protein
MIFQTLVDDYCFIPIISERKFSLQDRFQCNYLTEYSSTPLEDMLPKNLNMLGFNILHNEALLYTNF